jgi:hypothetical protein
MLHLGEEESQGKRALVARAKRVAETRLVERRIVVAEIDRGIVDENPKAGGGNPAPIIVLGPGDAETGLEIIEQCVDCVLVSVDDLFGVFIELGADICFLVFEGLFFFDCGFMGSARGAGGWLMAGREALRIFMPSTAFAARTGRFEAVTSGLRSGLSLHLIPDLVRILGAARLVSTPSRTDALRPSLARDCHAGLCRDKFRFPRI